MSELLRQLPFLFATFALSFWVFPEEVLGWFDDEFDPTDLFYLVASIVAFAVGVAATYVVAIESFGAYPEPRPGRE